VGSERSVKVGNVQIGGGAPVVVQSMTLTPTRDVTATTAQIAALASAGCEVVRCAVPKIEDAEALKKIVRLSPLPVIADIHFNASLALRAIDAGVAAVRINPGNIGGPEKVAEVVVAAKRAGIPMRIGANSGSLPKHLRGLAEQDQAQALLDDDREVLDPDVVPAARRTGDHHRPALAQVQCLEDLPGRVDLLHRVGRQ